MSTPTTRITRDFTFDVKSVTDTGLIEGYASVFNNVDSHGDIIAGGAFTRTLKAWEAKGRKVPVLWQHDAFDPVGVTESITEDQHGLRIVAQLVPEVQRAREAHALAKAGALGGLSIGFSVPALASDGEPATTYDEERRARVFREVRLWEYSLVTFPANEDATITSVKADLAALVTDLRAALDDRETLKLLREIKQALQHATPPTVGALDVDPALTGLLTETRSVLARFTKGTPS
jgi:HK97 family phage prohead protease